MHNFCRIALNISLRVFDSRISNLRFRTPGTKKLIAIEEGYLCREFLLKVKVK